MKTKILISLFLATFLGASFSYAAVTGQVKNTNRAPVADAIVTFTNEADPADSYVVTTDEIGRFSVQIANVAVEDMVPDEFALGQNFPNPFNPTTSIPFSLDAESHVDLSIYNVMGQKIRTLVNGSLSAGSHIIQWNGCDDHNRFVSAGIYFCRLKGGEHARIRKMLLLDGGSHGSGGNGKTASVSSVKMTAAKRAAVSYTVTIVADGCADFSESGVTLADGQKRNFTVYPNNGMIVSTVITGGVANISYIGTISGLDVGSHTNTNSYENIATYPGVFVYGDMVLMTEDQWGDIIYQYRRGENGELTQTGSMVKKVGGGSIDIVFVNESKAYLTLQDLGLLQVIDPATLTVIKELDLTEYAVGENDYNPEPIDMVIRGDKLFVGLHQSKSMYIHEVGAYVLIVDIASDTVDKMISDPRSSSVGWYSSGNQLIVDDYGDIYVGCNAMYGMGPEDVHPGLLRINSGETEFDPDYFFDLTEVDLPDVPGNRGIYMYPTYLCSGGSTIYSYCMVPGLMSDPPDYANDRPTAAFKFNLRKKTAEKIDLGSTNAYGIGLCGYDNKIVFGLTTVDGDGLYTYDPKTGEASKKPVVTTVGYPMVLKAF